MLGPCTNNEAQTLTLVAEQRLMIGGLKNTERVVRSLCGHPRVKGRHPGRNNEHDKVGHVCVWRQSLTEFNLLSPSLAGWAKFWRGTETQQKASPLNMVDNLEDSDAKTHSRISQMLIELHTKPGELGMDQTKAHCMSVIAWETLYTTSPHASVSQNFVQSDLNLVGLSLCLRSRTCHKLGEDR